MLYQITENLLTPGREHNRPGTPLRPVGICLHETATPGATDEDERAYFNAAYRKGSANYFTDYDSVTRTIPEDEQSWGAGETANSRYIHVEMGHFDDPARFQATWDRTVWLFADICRRHGWDPLMVGDSPIIVTHDWCRQQWHETNHTDPTAYFKAHGKDINQFRAEVAAALAPAQRAVVDITAAVDGKQLPAVLIDGKSYVAARELATALGYQVAWDEANKRVILSKA